MAARNDVPGWVLSLTREELEEIFGTTTVKRGVTYQRRGAVQGLQVTADGDLTATVHGGRRYQALAWSEDVDDGYLPDLVSTCSCPVGEFCKHGAAMLLQAQAQAETGRRPTRGPGRAGPLTPAPASWETLLRPVLDEAQAPSAGSDPNSTPLALDFRVNATGYGPTTLLLRPLMKGASGAWIKTGVTWSQFQYPHLNPRLDDRQRAVLREMLQASFATASHYAYYQAPGDTISSDALGPRLWELLRRASEVGVALVTDQRTPVRLLDPVDFALDVTRDVEGTLTVSPAVDLPEIPGPVILLGRPGHGLIVQDPPGLDLVPLTRPLTPALSSLLGSVDQVRIPPAEAERFLSSYYPALSRSTRVTSTDGSVEFPEVAPPRLGLQVRFEADHVTRLHWTFRYAVGQQVHVVPLLRTPGLSVGQLVEGETADPVARDAQAEEALLASLEILDRAPGLRIPLAGRTRLGVVLEPVLQAWATVQFVRDVLPALQQREDVHVRVIGEPLPYEEVTEAPVVHVSTQDLAEGDDRLTTHGPGLGGDLGSQDWFGLDITVTVGDRPVPLPDLLTALTRQEEFLLRPDGTWFALDTPELETLRRLVEEAQGLSDDPERPGRLRINRFQAGLWEELVELGVVGEQSERWQRTVGALLALDEVPHPDPPEGLTATLRSYQLDGYQWLSFLWEHELGGILADDMGLGKTVQTLAAAERAREQGRLTPERPMLVVAPTSVIDTWAREAARFTPYLKVAAVTETVRRAGRPLAETIDGAHLVVTSYTLLRIDEEHLTDRAWSAVVLDEAQAVKNHQSRTYHAARRLTTPVKLAITGTPLENSLMDLWSLLSLGAPGLFPSPKQFTAQWRKPIESGADPELLGTLRRRIRPLMLRRTKDAVATDLPPKIEQVLRVPLNASHRRIYDTHLQRERQRILGLLDDVDRNRIAILAALTRLRQLALDVHLVVPDAPASARPSKVDALVEQLLEVAAEGHRCLVFSQFTGFLKVVRERLDAEGIGHVYLDGRTRDRPRRIAQFTDGDDPVFLISLKAGGSGLTLTEADYVFVLDPWWNPAVEAQAVDRTHRIGQDKTVMVYRLVAEDTIEEKVVALQERKRELFDKVVDEGGLLAAPLSADDIRGLLGG